MAGRKIFVGLSGGVDSSVAALLLREQGHDVTGVFLRCVNLDGCAEQDAEDARRVAAHIGIPFFSWDFEEEYRRAVVDPLLAGYASGETPNPDIHCNRTIKFGAFLDAALRAGADAVATGHYAQVQEVGGRTSLVAGADPAKDQSYFLAALTEEQLHRAVFPVGGMRKGEVRRLAREAGLPTAEKKDSQGICFLGKVSLTSYLKEQLPGAPGPVLSTSGEKIGEHDGATFVTVGQRSGFRVRARGQGDTPPRYVVGRDVAANTVTVAEAGDPALLTSGFALRDVVGQEVPEAGVQVLARTRYRQPLSSATLSREGERHVLRFVSPHPAAAPGQYAVCYSPEGVVFAAGAIAESL